MQEEILVYNPTAESRRKLEEVVQGPTSLVGRRIGIIDNAKPNSDVLAKHMGRTLQERYGVAEIVYKVKRGPTTPAPESYYDELARACDLVVTGSGD